MKKMSYRRKLFLAKEALGHDIREVCEDIAMNGFNEEKYAVLRQLTGEYKELKKKELKKLL